MDAPANVSLSARFVILGEYAARLHLQARRFMRTTRWKIALVSSALIGAHASASALAAQDTTPLTPAPAATADAILYPATLTYGTGLIDIPVAWVSSNSGDVWVTASGKIVNYCGAVCTINFSDKFNTNLSIDTHWK